MSKALFFELLHQARRLRSWTWASRRAYLMGMMRSYLNHLEDIERSANLVDWWKHAGVAD